MSTHFKPAIIESNTFLMKGYTMDAGQIDKMPQMKTGPQPGKRKLALFILLFLACLLFVLALIFTNSLLNRTTLYRGILVDGKDMGGLTREELFAYLEEHYADAFQENSLTLSSDRFERNITFSEMGFRLDIGAMCDKAYALGRTGTLYQRITQILRLKARPQTLDLVIDFETQAFNSLLDTVCQQVFREVVPTNIVIYEDKAVLHTGMPGQEADREKLKSDIIQAVMGTGPRTVRIAVTQRLPAPIDFDTTLKTLNQDPIDAEFVKTSRTTYEIKPHQNGRKISRAQLLEVMNYLETRETNDYEEILLPVEFIAPKVTDEQLKAQTFRDTLAAYTTYFQTDTQNNINRGINIGLAAQSIDGTILMPGEEFSFNQVVGPRTPDKGYKIAHVYVAGEIRDGTGGGICQVSTTLYNAVLRANLAVTERHNHMFTVGYVPLGTDAAVSYGYADLVFQNTTAHPLMISIKVTGNQLTVRLLSTNDYPDMKVKIATKTLRKIPIKEQIIDDPSLPSGTVQVVDQGMDGYEVETYIKIFMGDVLIREEKIHKSYYQMLPRKIIRGTAPVMDSIMP